MNKAVPDDVISLLSQWDGAFPRPLESVASDLMGFCEILTKWQVAKNLVSRETLTDFWTRHIADSLQILPQVGDARSVCDLGSGGGFPALPLAIATKGSDIHFTLRESNGKKVSFLRTIARQFELSVTVDSRRLGDSRETEQFDLITARALARLDLLLSYAHPLVKSEGRIVAHKGREYSEELDEAGARWQFDVLTIPSITSSDGALLDIRHLRVRDTQGGIKT